MFIDVESDDLYMAIGRVSVETEKLHYQLAMLASNLCSRDGKYQVVGQVLTAVTSLRQTIDICRMLYVSSSENNKNIQEFMALLKRAEDLSAKRNRFLHAEWTPTGDGDTYHHWRFTKDKKEGIKISELELTPKEINKIADEAKELLMDITLFPFKEADTEGAAFTVGRDEIRKSKT